MNSPDLHDIKYIFKLDDVILAFSFIRLLQTSWFWTEKLQRVLRLNFRVKLLSPSFRIKKLRFCIQKFSLWITHSVKISLSRFVFVNLSISVNFACLLKSWPLFGKCLSADIVVGSYIIPCRLHIVHKWHMLSYNLYCELSSKFCLFVGSCMLL